LRLIAPIKLESLLLGEIHDYDLVDIMAQKEALSAKRRTLKLSKSHWVEDKAA